MAEVEILHRLHSHAAADTWSDIGWQNVRVEERDAAEALPNEVLLALDGLMTNITPAGSGTAWVVCRFADGTDTYACVIAAYPDLVVDGVGRSGLLTHARLVRVSSEQAWLDAAALVELAEGFAIGDVRAAAPAGQLRQYLDLLSEESAIMVREVTVTDLELPRTFLRDALVGCLNAIGKRQQTRVAVPRRSNRS